MIARVCVLVALLATVAVCGALGVWQAVGPTNSMLLGLLLGAGFALAVPE